MSKTLSLLTILMVLLAVSFGTAEAVRGEKKPVAKTTIVLQNTEGANAAADAISNFRRVLKEEDGDDEDCSSNLADGECEICSRCNKDNRPTTLTFRYVSNGQTSRFQGDRATCVAGSYPTTATITVGGQTFTINDGDIFSLVANGGFSAETQFTIAGFGTCEVHTSCSVPIVTGDIIGPFEVIGPTDSCDPVDPVDCEEEQCVVCDRDNKDFRPSQLTFIYRSAGQTSVLQGDLATCLGGTYPATATIQVLGQTFTVTDGDQFTVFSEDGDEFSAVTEFTIVGFGTCEIHTSCSAPIVAGDVIGPYEVVGDDQVCTPDRCEPTPCSDTGCLICDSDNKDFRPEQLTFIYRSNGQNSLYQDEDKASCRADVYPTTTTITVAGQSFTVTDGDTFTVFSEDGDSFPANLEFTFSGYGTCFIHASCSVPIITGDVIGPLEVVTDNNVCVPCPPEAPECVVPDALEYECDTPITVNFNTQDFTDLAGQPGPFADDWIGIYPCNTAFASDTVFFPIIRKYICDDFTNDAPQCWQDPNNVFGAGTVVIDELPEYGQLGPFIWPVAPFINPFDPTQTIVDSFKLMIIRNDGPSVPPYIPFCESACFTISTNNRRVCRLREDGATRLPPRATFGCFPGDAIVQIENVGRIRMEDLEIGDKVLTAKGYEPVYSFGHRYPEDTEEYLMIFSELSILDISKEHMVFVEGGAAVPAGMLQPGDKLQMHDGQLSEISHIKSVDKDGIYVPFTKSGTIVVNNVVASTFIAYQKSATLKIGSFDTGVSFQFFAHSFGIIHQAWCGGICHNEQYTENGISAFVARPHAATRWLMDQNVYVMAVVVAAVVAFLSMVAYPTTILAGALFLFTSTRFRHQTATAKSTKTA